MVVLFQEEAYAKINLYLHVTGKRADGYHLLDSLAVFPKVGDELKLLPVQEKSQEDLVSLEIQGPFAHQLANEDHAGNLIIKTAKRLAGHMGTDLPKARIVLKKNLPVASGIGGGSSDAAATLRLLMRYWNARVEERELLALALSLGADVPVCLDPVPQRMQGVGEHVSKGYDIPDFGMVLVNHGKGVSTAEVFHKQEFSFSEAVSLPKRFEDIDSFFQKMLSFHNDLQGPALSVNPMIANVLKAIRKLPDCQLVRMSGSGATCFGLFKTVEQAVHAADILSRNCSWWVWGGKAVH